MKIRTIAAALTAAVMTAAMTVTAFAAAVPSGRNLPEFRYTNDAPYMNTILDYVKKTDGQYYDAGDVMIPNYIVLRADESDPQDVKIWGNFWTMNYDLQGDNLFLLTPYPGWDPEVSNNMDPRYTWTNNLNVPQPRTFTFGVNLSF